MQSGHETLAGGKHNGKTFATVLQTDRSYCQFIVDKMGGNAKWASFIEYLVKTGMKPSSAQGTATSNDASPPSAHQPAAQSVPLIGEQRGAPSAAASSSVFPQGLQRSAGHQDGPDHQKACDSEHVCEKCGSDELQSWQKRCGPCFREHARRLNENFYLNVRFEDKDEAKARGRVQWDNERKRWFVPAGGDISLWERWHVRCCECGESINYIMAADPNKVQCPGNECAPERRAREEREARERDEAERLRNKVAYLMKKRDAFWKFLLQQARDTEQNIKDMNSKAEEKLLADKAQPPNKKRRTSTSKAAVSIPFPHFLEGELTQLLEESKGEKLYNPFTADDVPDLISGEAASWIRSVGSNDFVKMEKAHSLVFEYRPVMILRFGCTFHAFEELFEQWLPWLPKMEKFIRHSLLQSLDAVTPDMAALIQQKLRAAYETHCPDVEGIFGGRILPRCRETCGPAWDASYTREQKINRAILEYMDNRKTYDAICGETEKTTFMRDVMTQVVDKLCDDQDVLEFEEEGGDRLYWNKLNDGKGNCLMLAHPNTKAADLFSLEQARNAARKMITERSTLGERINLDLPAGEHRARIFAAFRKLHWRIVREVGGGGYATYGVDEGLRNEDCDKRFTTFRQHHAMYHEELMECKWCLRDWVGFHGKRLHSNEKLISVVFSDWLGLNEKLVSDVQKKAERDVKAAAKNVEKRQKALKKELRAQGIDVRSLMEDA